MAELGSFFEDLFASRKEGEPIVLTEAQLILLTSKVQGVLTERELLQISVRGKDSEIASLTLQLLELTSRREAVKPEPPPPEPPPPPPEPVPPPVALPPPLPPLPPPPPPRPSNRLPEDCETILKLFAESRRGLSDQQLADTIPMPLTEVQSLLDTLEAGGFILGVTSMVSVFAADPPRDYEITPDGRAYAVNHLR